MCFCDGGRRWEFSGRRPRISLKKNKRKEIYNTLLAPPRAPGVGPAYFLLRRRLSFCRGPFLFFASASCLSESLLLAFRASAARVGKERKCMFVCSFWRSCPASASCSARSLPAGGGGAPRSVFPAGGAVSVIQHKEKRQLLYYARPSSGRAAGRRRFRILRAERELPRRLRVTRGTGPRRL